MPNNVKPHVLTPAERKTRFRNLFSFSRVTQRRFVKNTSGVAAVEFALVFPILLILYLGSVEISGGLQTNKDVGKAASLVGDLVTQSPQLTTAELVGIADIAEATIFPYTTTTPVTTLVGIKIDTTNPKPKAKVEWSRRIANGAQTEPYAKGSPITIPDRLLLPDTFVVKSTVELKYKPIVTHNMKDTEINMEETYYLRPRLTDEVQCTNC
ncbi:MAG: TadE/TadG family type IV pilus assembly protein [Pseudomonadota bacterium]